jgi:hypothetical protein
VHSIRTYKVPAGLVAKASLLLLRRSANCSDQVFRLLEDKTVVFCAPYASNVRVPFVDADFDVGNFARGEFISRLKSNSQRSFLPTLRCQQRSSRKVRKLRARRPSSALRLLQNRSKKSLENIITSRERRSRYSLSRVKKEELSRLTESVLMRA